MCPAPLGGGSSDWYQVTESSSAAVGHPHFWGCWSWITGPSAVRGHADFWEGGANDTHSQISWEGGSNSSGLCLHLESKMAATAHTLPWSSYGQSPAACRCMEKAALAHPSPHTPPNIGPMALWQAQASSQTPSVVVHCTLAPQAVFVQPTPVQSPGSLKPEP